MDCHDPLVSILQLEVLRREFLDDEGDLGRLAAEDIIERLHDKGHIYEVEGKIRLTDYSAK